MPRKLLTSVSSLAALAAFVVVPVTASASPVLTETLANVVPVGAKIEAANTVTIAFTSTPEIRCDTSTLTGEVVTNSGTLFEITVTKATFEDHGSNPCTNVAGGDATVTTEIATTDWCIKSVGGGTDKFALSGGKCGGKAVALNFSLDIGAMTCTYSRGASEPVEGTFSTGPGPIDTEGAVFTFTNQVFKKTGGGGFCPTDGKLDGAYDIKTDNSLVSIFIS
jgi:hypothetical protein